MDLKARLGKIYSGMDQATGGSISIVRDAFQSFGKARAGQAAAGMAYYAFFSLFPLLLVLVTVGTIFLQQGDSYQRVMNYLSGVLPVSRSLINQNLQEVVKARGPLGAVAVIGAIWSASGAFSILALNINMAWPAARPRGFLQQRLLAVGMVIILALLLIVAVAATAITSLIIHANIPVISTLVAAQATFVSIISRALPWLISFALFTALYHWVPHVHVKWGWAAIGGLFAAIAWVAAINLFAWYVSSGLAKYNLVYGSLGALVALLFWIYLSSWIFLFGAHLSAAVGHAKE